MERGRESERDVLQREKEREMEEAADVVCRRVLVLLKK
jgi:hypothetical protein